MYDIDDLIEPRKRGQKPRDPFAQSFDQINPNHKNYFQYEVLGQQIGDSDKDSTEEFRQRYQREYKGKRAHIEYMSPDKYFDTVNKGFNSIHDDRQVIENINNYINPMHVEAAKKGDKFAMPYINYRNGKFSGQEGRHRAAMAKELGVEKMPVVIIDERDEYKDSKWYLKEQSIRDELNKKKQNPFTFDEELI